MTDDDDLADKYLLADERLAAAGLGWYEVSNWAPRRGQPLPPQPALLDRRRLVGRRPGRALPRRRACAGGTCEHPAAYADRIAAGLSPGHGREVLDAREPPRRAGAARAAAARGARPGRARRRPASPPCRRWWPTASWCPATGRWCSPSAAGCWPTPSCATCCREPAQLTIRSVSG